MKYIWEEKDIIPGRICKRKDDKGEKYIITYLPFPSDKPLQFSIVSLTDGLMVFSGMEKSDLAVSLTEMELVPYRFIQAMKAPAKEGGGQ